MRVIDQCQLVRQSARHDLRRHQIIVSSEGLGANPAPTSARSMESAINHPQDEMGWMSENRTRWWMAAWAHRIVRLLPFTESIRVVVAITWSFVVAIKLRPENEVSFSTFLAFNGSLFHVFLIEVSFYQLLLRLSLWWERSQWVALRFLRVMVWLSWHLKLPWNS